jgi:TRAP-type C4-dicarboxylate transport system substrate-binding protein
MAIFSRFSKHLFSFPNPPGTLAHSMLLSVLKEKLMRPNKSLIVLYIAANVLLITPSGFAANTVFKIATVSPDGATWMTKMRQGASEIERRTDGRVRFKFYPGGIMGSDQSVLRKIRVGQLQGGAITVGSLSEIYPDSQIYGFPMMFDSIDEVDYVRKRLDDRILKGLEERGLVSFGFAEAGFAYLMSSKPLRSIDDAKSRKVWISSGDEISRAVFDIAGISPVPLPVSDVLTGLQTGLLDTVGTSPIAAIAMQWFTRVKYLTDTPLSYITATLVIDRDSLEKLAVADQGIVREVMARQFTEINAQNRRDNVNALEALRTQGIIFVVPTSQEFTQWKTIATKAREQLIARGHYSADIIGVLRNHLDTFRKLRASVTSNDENQRTTALR